jgi:hypothetical protein
VASKLAWLMGKRGLIVALTMAAAAVFGGLHHVSPDGLWDGPG